MLQFCLLSTLIFATPNPIHEVEIERIDGTTTRGELKEITASGTISIASDRIDLKQIMRFRRIHRPISPWPRESQLIFINGDRIPVRFMEADQRILQVEPRWNANSNPNSHPLIRVPLSRLDAMWFVPPPSDGMEPNESANARKRDRIFLKNGDFVDGNWNSLPRGKDELSFDIQGKARNFPQSQIEHVRMNRELSSARIPEEMYWMVTLANGTRLSLVSIKFDPENLAGVTFYKSNVKIPLQEIIQWEMKQGPIVDATQLSGIAYRYRTYLNESQSWRLNRNLSGQQLSLMTSAGRSYFDSGFSQPSESELEFKLDGKYRFFLTEVGLDPELGKSGQVSIRIVLDGQDAKLPDLKQVKLSTGSIPIRIPVENCRKMTLIVEWGQGGNVGDVVNWVQPRLLKK